jgi:molybdopterin-guanine dinucleotide biosynthesis protein A
MNKPPLYALLLIGGHSRRMGMDKSWLDYHGKPQWKYNLELLETLTDKVFISVRKGQQVDYHNLIEDLYDDLGPFGAIMTAMQTYPEAAFLVFATDIPFLGKEHLKFLVKERDLHYRATAYQGLGKDYPEPLACIWEPEMISEFQKYYKKGIFKTIQLLKNNPIKTLPIDENAIQNINTYDEYLNCKKDRR